ncbi:MAG: hypothetical protein GEU78_09675 [Actinobacteria bacterium]|nr:hypothetical protein [Actinomycetota bacterium]
MAVTVAARNIAADAVGAAVSHQSLHTNDGGADGLSGELTGGAYAKQVPSYSTGAATGIDDLTAAVVFDAGGTVQTVTHLGFWGSAGSVWLGSVALTVSKQMSGTDTLTITSAPITA